jgi:hypothetical protein
MNDGQTESTGNRVLTSKDAILASEANAPDVPRHARGQWFNPTTPHPSEAPNPSGPLFHFLGRLHPDSERQIRRNELIAFL